MNSTFESSLINTDLYKELVPYLLGKDLINLLLVSKYIYNEGFIKKYLDKKTQYITKLFKKYHILNSFVNNEFNTISNNYFRVNRNFIDCPIARKYQAMLYYSFYRRKYRYSWYNDQLVWKKVIVDTYKKKHTNEPTKYDLYILIKSMSVNESILIGW
jgi:hypothetical protein